MSFETTTGTPVDPTFEIPANEFEAIMQPNEVLAAQYLDRCIQTAEADPQADPEVLTLLRFQRGLVDMSSPDANLAARGFVRQTGKYATFADTFGKRPPSLHYEVNRDLFVGRMANSERWQIIGVDPQQYGTDPYANAYRNGVEDSWREAREARLQLQAAQNREARAMAQATNPPVFIPRNVA